MKFIPILFSTKMVKALLDGRKTQTRRVNGLELLNDSPDFFIWLNEYPQMDIPRPARPYDNRFYYAFTGKNDNSVLAVTHCPYGKPGDILWVRETLYQEGELGLKYVADNEYIDEDVIPEVPFKNGSYRNYAHCNVPNIHMPAWAARIFLQVKEVRVERLQDISEVDAKAEGVENLFSWNPLTWKNYTWDGIGGDNSYQGYSNAKGAKESFESLWYSLNGKASWDLNPWVWVVQIERIDKPKNW